MSLFNLIKEYCNFKEVANYYGIEFSRSGKVLCPFRDEKTPSFHNYGTHGYCFGCGKVADAIDLETHFTGLPPFEAALSLAKRYGIQLPEFSPRDKEKAEKQAAAYKLLERFAKWTQRNLNKHPEVLEFLKSKGLDEVDINRWLIGYTGDENPVANSLKDKSEIELAEEIGLINQHGDHFRNRIIFPIWNYGKIVFLTGRAFPNGEPKYLHLKNSELVYRQIGFAENLKKDVCVIVESITDAIAFIKSGIPACALLGTNLGDKGIEALSKSKGKLYFCLDKDEAGERASYRIAKDYKGYTLDLGYDKDPDEILVELGPEEFQKLAEKAIEKARYFLDLIIEKESIEQALGEIATLEMQSEKDIWVAKLGHKHKAEAITISSLRRDLLKIEREKEQSGSNHPAEPPQEAIDLLADPKPQLHPAMDLIDEKLFYGTSNGSNKLLIHERRVLRALSIEEKYEFTGMPNSLRFSLKGIKTYHHGAEIRGVKLYTWISDLLYKYIVFKAGWQLVITALWIVGTYVHRCFDLYPYLWIQSPTKRCGKTLFLEILAELCFNSKGVETAATEAVLFREPAITAGTLCWDEAEGLTDATKRGERNSILNVSFRKGGKVSRCEGESHEVKDYEVYRPIALAGISSLPDSAADRSLKIELIRKRKDEKVERMKLRRLRSEFQSLRDALHIFALERAPQLIEAYENFHDNIIPVVVDHRLQDIFEVVFSIAGGLFCYDGDRFPPILASLQDAARALSGLREAAEDEISFIRAIQILKRRLDESQDKKLILKSEQAVNIFQSGGIDWVVENKHAGNLLRKLGFRSASHRVGDAFVRGYEIRLQHIEDLFQRYGGTLQNEDVKYISTIYVYSWCWQFKSVTTVTKPYLQGFYAIFPTVTKGFRDAFEK